MWITERSASRPWYPVYMEDEAPREATPASQDPAAPLNSAPATTVSSDASDASASPVAALANDLKYTLTVEQGRSIFAANQRKVPAVRTLQNYCVEGRIAAKKISTSYGQEWLLNETSLLAFIENEPQLTAAPQATPASQDPGLRSTPRPQQPQAATLATHRRYR